MFRRTFSRTKLLKRGWLLGLLLCASAWPLTAQAQMPVNKVVISSVGPQTVSEALIRANIKVKEGDKVRFSAEKAGSAIVVTDIQPAK